MQPARHPEADKKKACISGGGDTSDGSAQLGSDGHEWAQQGQRTADAVGEGQTQKRREDQYDGTQLYVTHTDIGRW